MPRPKKAMPAKFEDPSNLASVLEKCSEEVGAIRSALRKPASLVLDPQMFEVMNDLDNACQTLSDLAVGVSFGRVELAVSSVEIRIEKQLQFDFDAIGDEDAVLEDTFAAEPALA